MPEENSKKIDTRSTKAMTDQVFENLISNIAIIRKKEKEYQRKIDYNNYEISEQVLERLLLRHSILARLENIESSYEANLAFLPRAPRTANPDADLPTDKPKEPDPKPADGEPAAETNAQTAEKAEAEVANRDGNPAKPDDPNSKEHIAAERALRAYRLAVTDLFVEKAISYLEQDYTRYVEQGRKLFLYGAITIIVGTVVSATLVFIEQKSGMPPGATSHAIWVEFLSKFVKTFTLFGFLVLFAVYCTRLGKAMMDQAERLRERRHSLRQGRLFVHLNNGEASVDELVKAFDWNVLKGNAFGNIQTEASAPWGSVIKEALKAIPEAFKKSGGKD